MIDLTPELEKQFLPREEADNIIHASGVHAILNQWENRPPDFQAMIRMWNGTWKHKMVQELLPQYKHEVKKEVPYKNIILSGTMDCLTDDHGLEIKTSEKLFDSAKEWHVTQCKLYASMFEVPYIYVVQPVIRKNTLELKRLRRVGRNDEWFSETLETLNNYYESKRRNAKRS